MIIIIIMCANSCLQIVTSNLNSFSSEVLIRFSSKSCNSAFLLLELTISLSGLLEELTIEKIPCDEVMTIAVGVIIYTRVNYTRGYYFQKLRYAIANQQQCKYTMFIL